MSYNQGYYARITDIHNDLIATFRTYSGIYQGDNKRYFFSRSETYPLLIKELNLLKLKHPNKFSIDEPRPLAYQTWLLSSPTYATFSSNSSGSYSSSTTSPPLSTSTSTSISTLPRAAVSTTTSTKPNNLPISSSSSNFTIPLYTTIPTDLSTRLPAKLLSILLPFQMEGIKFCIQRSGCALIADEMGCGKTLQATATALYYRNLWPLLVICPAALVLNWKQEILQWAPDSIITVLNNTTALTNGNITNSWNPRNEIRQSKQRSSSSTSSTTNVLSCTAPGTGTSSPSSTPLPKDCEKLVTIISMQRIPRLVSSKVLQAGDFQAIIIDESHNLKSWQAQRTTAIKSIIQNSSMRLLLSGTPAPNRLAELHPQLYFINSRLFSSYDEFATRYCDRRVSHFGYNAYDDRGESCIEELSCILQYHTMIRRTKRDVLSMLPPKNRQLLHISMTKGTIENIILLQIEMDQINTLMNNIQHNPNHPLQYNHTLSDKDNIHLQYLLRQKQRLMLSMYETMGIGKAPAVMEHILQYLRPLPGQNFLAIPDTVIENNISHGKGKKRKDSGQSSSNGNTKRNRLDKGNTIDEEEEEVYYTTEKQETKNVSPQLSSDSISGGFFAEEDNNPTYTIPTGKASIIHAPYDRNTIIDISDSDSDEDTKKPTITTNIKQSSSSTGTKTNLNLHLHDKMIVFAHHQEVLNYLETELRKRGIKYVRIDGNTTATVKDERKTLFQTKTDIQIALLSIKASGVGLSFTKASIAVFAELDWTPSNLLQAEDRIHRIGQTAPRVDIHYLLCPSVTIDQHYQPLLRDKSSIVYTQSTNHGSTGNKKQLPSTIKSPDDAMWNILAAKLDTIEKAIQSNTGLLDRRNDGSNPETDLDDNDDDEESGNPKKKGKKETTSTGNNTNSLDGEVLPEGMLQEFMNGFTTSNNNNNSTSMTSILTTKGKSENQQSAVSFFQRGAKSTVVPTSPVNTLLNHFTVLPNNENSSGTETESTRRIQPIDESSARETETNDIVVILDSPAKPDEYAEEHIIQEDTQPTDRTLSEGATNSAVSENKYSFNASTELEGPVSVGSTVLEGGSINTADDKQYSVEDNYPDAISNASEFTQNSSIITSSTATTNTTSSTVSSSSASSSIISTTASSNIYHESITQLRPISNKPVEIIIDIPDTPETTTTTTNHNVSINNSTAHNNTSLSTPNIPVNNVQMVDDDLLAFLDQIDPPTQSNSNTIGYTSPSRSRLPVSIHSSPDRTTIRQGEPPVRRPLYLPYRHAIHVPDRQILEAIPLPRTSYSLDRNAIYNQIASPPAPSGAGHPAYTRR